MPEKKFQIIDDINFINQKVTKDNFRFSDKVNGCYASVDYYESLEDKIAPIVRALIKNHYFFDGNKRTALVVFIGLCMKNGIHHMTMMDAVWSLVNNADRYGKLFEDIAMNNYPVHEISKMLFPENIFVVWFRFFRNFFTSLHDKK